MSIDMNIIDSLILFFFIALAVYIIIGLFRSIMKSSQQGETFYQNLLERIKKLRMHRMLQTLGVNEKDYALAHPVSEIEMHMNRCRQCSNTEICDSELAKGEVNQAEQYCPNNKDLLQTSFKTS
jgi:hypothetical protein